MPASSCKGSSSTITTCVDIRATIDATLAIADADADPDPDPDATLAVTGAGAFAAKGMGLHEEITAMRQCTLCPNCHVRLTSV